MVAFGLCAAAVTATALPPGTATCSTRPSQPCEVGKPVTLTIPAITFPLQSVVWNFDDGTSVTTTTPSVSHTFNTLGSHGASILINGESNTGVGVYIGYGFISVTGPTATVSESVGSVSIAFTRNEASLPANVAYTTYDGTAIAGVSYGKTAGTLSFAAGELQKTISVPIIDNTSYDGNVYFFIEGTSQTAGYFVDNRTTPPGYAPDTSAYIHIAENDSTPLLWLEPDSYSARETDGHVTIVLHRANDLSHSAYGHIAVDYSDTVPWNSGVIVTPDISVTFAPNETSKSVTLPITHDGYYQGDATIPIVLIPTAPSTAGTPSRVNVYVAETDVPTVSINDVTVKEGDAHGTAAASFSITTNSFQKLHASVQLVDGTAKQGTDFGPPAVTSFDIGGTLSLDRTFTVTVPIFGNDVKEHNRTFTAVLSSPTATVLRTGTCTITDDDVEVSPTDMKLQAGTTQQVELRVGEPATSDRALNVSSSGVIVPPVVTLPAGATSVQIPVTGGEWGDSLLTITTSLQLFSRTFHVATHVFTNAAPHVLPLSLLVKPGGSAALTTDIFPSQVGPTKVVLTSSDPYVATATPPIIEVPPGGSAQFSVTAKAVGHATLTAYAGGTSMATVSVTVADGDQPILFAVAPNDGPPAGGTIVTLSGGNFRDTCTVHVGASEVPAALVDAQTLSIVTPPHEPAIVDLNVVCGSQTATLPQSFTYFTVRRRSARH